MSVGGAAAMALLSGPAFAQTPASTGSTEVAVPEGIQSYQKPVGEETDATTVNIAGGALFAAGNSKSLAVTGSADARVRRKANQGKASFAANYAQAGNQAEDNGLDVTVENYQGNLRYDYFIKSVAPFLSVSGRHDRFQGLDLRLNIDPGVAYYFVDQEKQQFWGELGYDLQHDIRSEEAQIDAEVAGTPVDKTETRHNARLFVGYTNEVNTMVTFKTGLEYLQAFVDPENLRVNWDLAVTSKLAGNFSMATTIYVKYDNNPLPDIEKTDVVTAINLVYGLY